MLDTSPQAAVAVRLRPAQRWSQRTGQTPEVLAIMPMLRSQTDAARLLDVPESTLRSWIKKFRPYVITAYDHTGAKVYDIDRLKELAFVCDKWAKTKPRKSLSEVGRELARRYPEEAASAGIRPPAPPDFEARTATEAASPQATVDVGALAHEVAALAHEVAVVRQVFLDLRAANDEVRSALSQLAELQADAARRDRERVEHERQREELARESVRLQGKILAFLQGRADGGDWPWYLWFWPPALVAYITLTRERSGEDDGADDAPEADPPRATPLQLVAPREGS